MVGRMVGTKLIQVRGEVQFYNLESRLNDSQVRQLAPVLLPVLKAWATREREWSLIRAASSFGKRLAVFDGLVRYIRTAINRYSQYISCQLDLIYLKGTQTRSPGFSNSPTAEKR